MDHWTYMYNIYNKNYRYLLNTFAEHQHIFRGDIAFLLAMVFLTFFMDHVFKFQASYNVYTAWVKCYEILEYNRQ